MILSDCGQREIAASPLVLCVETAQQMRTSLQTTRMAVLPGKRTLDVEAGAIRAPTGMAGEKAWLEAKPQRATET